MPLLTVKEVASQLQLCEEVVRIKTRKGILVASKFGKGWRYRQEDVNSFVQKFQYAGDKGSVLEARP